MGSSSGTRICLTISDGSRLRIAVLKCSFCCLNDFSWAGVTGKVGNVVR